jgi:hypothetical protein
MSASWSNEPGTRLSSAKVTMDTARSVRTRRTNRPRMYFSTMFAPASRCLRHCQSSHSSFVRICEQ